jgi:hypothetical protein
MLGVLLGAFIAVALVAELQADSPWWFLLWLVLVGLTANGLFRSFRGSGPAQTRRGLVQRGVTPGTGLTTNLVIG